MKTKFTNQEYLLLAIGNDRNIAIIICKPGLRRINKKIIQAILDDFNANKIVVYGDTTIVKNGVTTIFKATIYSDTGNFEEYFKLINLTTY
jgi:hypothetical protein